MDDSKQIRIRAWVTIKPTETLGMSNEQLYGVLIDKLRTLETEIHSGIETVVQKAEKLGYECA